MDLTQLSIIDLVNTINTSGQNIQLYNAGLAEYRRRLEAIPVQRQYRPYPELIMQLGLYAGNTDPMQLDVMCEGLLHGDDVETGDISYKVLPYIDTTGTKRMLCPTCAMKA